MKVAAVKPEYPYTRIEKGIRAEFIERYEARMSREEALNLARELSRKGSSSERHRWYAEGFVRGLHYHSDAYNDDSGFYNHDVYLGWVSGLHTRREIQA